MNIPFIDLKASTALAKRGILNDWERILDNCEFVGGPTVKLLEEKLQEILKVPHALACANGTDAILVALQALGVKAGDRVAIPNLTFWATYEAVAQLGAIPVLIDINEDDLQMDFEEFRKAHHTHRFKFAVLVHLMGWATPLLHEFRKYCKSEGIELLEDGAQSFGVEVDGEPVYSKARISTLSFYPAKVVGGCMDGGAILSEDPKLIETCRSLCNHGRSSHYSYAHVGWNSRMGALQASFILRFLDHSSTIIEERRKAMDHYASILNQGSPQYKFFAAPKGVRGNGYLAVIQLYNHDAEKTASALKSVGIGVGRVYPETMD